jgi:hypothetical protein
MAEIAYRDALNQALNEEMARDPRVFLMGEEVARYNGAYKVSQGQLDKYGSARVEPDRAGDHEQQQRKSRDEPGTSGHACRLEHPATRRAAINPTERWACGAESRRGPGRCTKSY